MNISGHLEDMAEGMAARSRAERLCSVVASAEQQDPIGSGGSVSRLLAVEMPTPWGESFYDADNDGTVQQRMRAVQREYFRKARESGALDLPSRAGIPNFVGIAPDPEWSRPGERRVLIATRPESPFASFDIAEYVLPFDSSRIVDLVEAYFEAPERLPRFDEYRIEPSGHRNVFVCTHGHVDVCCARFGVPLYRQRGQRIRSFGRGAPPISGDTVSPQRPGSFRQGTSGRSSTRRPLRSC
jgi:hypothetical protein